MSEIKKQDIVSSVLLTIISCGIYGIYWQYTLIKNVYAIQKISKDILGEMLCIMFVPFYSLYWWYTRGETVKEYLTKEHHIEPKTNGMICLIFAIFSLGLVSMVLMQGDFNSLETNNQIERKNVPKLVFLALFVALSYALSFFSFPIFPATPYMKLDFSNIFILLTGLLFGPVEGVIVCVLKEIIGITNSSSGGVGELANAIMTTSFILLPSIVYRKKKKTKAAIISFIPACLIGTAVALVTNRFIIFPMYMGEGAAAVFESAFWFAVAFNLIKTSSISLITGVMLKRLAYFVKKYRI